MIGFGFKDKVVLALTSIALLVGSVMAEEITVDGKTRSMLVYAPSGIEKNRPLIIQMHGKDQDAAYQKNAAKWESIADTARFIVVFPNGEGKFWDISGDKDINFLKAIINNMYEKYGIDKKRVYVSGFSMGGMMSYHATNKMGDMIAAIAPVSGGGSPGSPKRSMPIFHTHGTTDNVVNYNGTVNTVKSWVSAQKCSSNSQVIKPYPANKSESAASLEIWSGCNDGVEVRLMSIKDKGHWYSMDEVVSVNTSVEIWNFVKNYSLDGVSPSAPAVVVPTNRDEIFNGGFDSSAVAWDLQLHGNASATGTVKEGQYVLDISAVGTENYQVQLIQHDLHLAKDTWYEISFDASADDARMLEVNVEQHNDPWASYLDEKQNFEIGTEMKTYSFKFMMTADTDTNSRLSFNAGSSTGTLKLDNVMISQVDYVEIPPEDSAGDSTTKLNTARMLLSGVEKFKVFSMNGVYLGRIVANQAGLYEATKNLVQRPGTFLVKSEVGLTFKLYVK